MQNVSLKKIDIQILHIKKGPLTRLRGGGELHLASRSIFVWRASVVLIVREVPHMLGLATVENPK